MCDGVLVVGAVVVVAEDVVVLVEVADANAGCGSDENRGVDDSTPEVDINTCV